MKRFAGACIGTGAALVIAELVARLVLSVPAVSDRLSQGGPYARLIGQLERYGWRRRGRAGWDYALQFAGEQPSAEWVPVTLDGPYLTGIGAVRRLTGR